MRYTTVITLKAPNKSDIAGVIRTFEVGFTYSYCVLKMYEIFNSKLNYMNIYDL